MSPTTITSFSSPPDRTAAFDQRKAQWQQWHREREVQLAQPHDWLSVVGLHWLTETPSAIDGFPGLFSVAADAAQVDPATISGIVDLRDGQPLVGPATAEVIEAKSLSWLQHTEVIAELIRRTGKLAIRLRDPQAPTRVDFTGVPTFEFAEKWIIEGTFAQFDEPKPVVVGGAQPGLEHHLTAVGSITFSIDSETVRLLAFGSPAGGLHLSFYDATNGRADGTNEGPTAPWRILGVAAPDADGNVILDFNRTLNLPFAFSHFGTCPKPPAENVINAAVDAGEKRPLLPAR